jgi:hypothetical protein
MDPSETVQDDPDGHDHGRPQGHRAAGGHGEWAGVAAAGDGVMMDVVVNEPR